MYLESVCVKYILGAQYLRFFFNVTFFFFY